MFRPGWETVCSFRPPCQMVRPLRPPASLPMNDALDEGALTYAFFYHGLTLTYSDDFAFYKQAKRGNTHDHTYKIYAQGN
jgi:hypothetical protein